MSLHELLNLGEKLYAIRPIVRSLICKVEPFTGLAWKGLVQELRAIVVQSSACVFYYSLIKRRVL